MGFNFKENFYVISIEKEMSLSEETGNWVNIKTKQ